MLNSDYRELCDVNLPHRNRQMYMHSFDLAMPVMAEGFEDYLGPVSALCAAARALEGIAHMTVDEKLVRGGMSQRRPQPHVDGCFMPMKRSWEHDGGGGGWLHTCNDITCSSEVHRMPVIVVANVPGCRAWRGKFDAKPASDGDLSHLQLGEGEVLEPNRGYLLSPDCVHESMVQAKDVLRTFLRIALPVDFAWQVKL